MRKIPRRVDPGRRMIFAFVGAGVLVLLMAIYLIMVFTSGDRVLGGTTVAGVDIGGMSRSEALRTLRTELRPGGDEPILVAAGEETHELDPERVGLRFDPERTVDQAYVETTFNPFALLGRLGSGGELDPVVDVDRDALSVTMERLAEDVDREAREARIVFTDGVAQPRMPVTGYALQQDDAARALRAEFVGSDPNRPIALPTEEVRSPVSEADVQEVMDTFAEPAMSGPVRIEFGEGEGEDGGESEGGEPGDEDGPIESIEATPQEIGAALVVVVDEDRGELTPRLRPKVFAEALQEKLDQALTGPRDARIEMSGGRPQVVPARSGRTVEPRDLSAAVLAVLTETGADRVAEPEVEEEDPELTTEELEELGVQEVVGEFSTSYPHAEYRNVNIGRAAELMNGTLILPDEVFSLNDTVGERTEANGFTGGYVIRGGALAVELGGGVSQTATTMYNAGFFAGMEDVEHRPHGFYISRYPVGREATVYWGSLDLKWRNNTPHGVYVESYINPSSPGREGSVTFKLWSTEYWHVETSTSDRYDVVPYEEIVDESEEGCVDQPSGVEGFTVDVHRELHRDGQLVDRETDVVRYNPEHQVTCTNPTDPPA